MGITKLTLTDCFEEDCPCTYCAGPVKPLNPAASSFVPWRAEEAQEADMAWCQQCYYAIDIGNSLLEAGHELAASRPLSSASAAASWTSESTTSTTATTTTTIISGPATPHLNPQALPFFGSLIITG